MMSRMARAEFDVLDISACPLLGLVGDPRTHFTFPHPGHRCHATRSPRGIDPARQSAQCLSPYFAACVLYRTRLRGRKAGRQPD
jgi:hypothetical protein